MIIKSIPRAFAATLALGITSIAALTPAHAVDGRTAARRCIERDDCTITIWPGDNGGIFTVTFDGGGVIWCPSLDGECVIVSPDTVKGGGVHPPVVAPPIATTPVPNAPNQPEGGRPVTNKPAPPRGIIQAPPKGTIGVPIGGRPIGFHPPRRILPPSTLKSIGNTGAHPAPILLLARGGGGHRR